MGANPTQALSVLLFFIGFTLLGAGFASGGSILLILVALVGIAAALMVAKKAKPWEHGEG